MSSVFRLHRRRAAPRRHTHFRIVSPNHAEFASGTSARASAEALTTAEVSSESDKSNESVRGGRHHASGCAGLLRRAKCSGTKRAGATWWVSDDAPRRGAQRLLGSHAYLKVAPLDSLKSFTDNLLLPSLALLNISRSLLMRSAMVSSGSARLPCNRSTARGAPHPNAPHSTSLYSVRSDMMARLYSHRSARAALLALLCSQRSGPR